VYTLEIHIEVPVTKALKAMGVADHFNMIVAGITTPFHSRMPILAGNKTEDCRRLSNCKSRLACLGGLTFHFSLLGLIHEDLQGNSAPVFLVICAIYPADGLELVDTYKQKQLQRTITEKKAKQMMKSQ